MGMHDSDIPQWMRCLLYLVSSMSSDARVSATMELVHFSWNIPNLATEIFS